MKDEMTFPPFRAWIEDPALDADKLLAIAAVGIMAESLHIEDAEAYDILRTYAVAAASKFGYAVNKS